MQIQLTVIAEQLVNARRIKTTPEQDAALRASMATLGQLQPVLVARCDDGLSYELRAGHRRLAAAQSLGWQTIAAEIMQDDIAQPPETAVSAAENMVRAAMHPVDQWRAISDLMASGGFNLETASAALGVSPALARRMQHLGAMAPEVIAAIGTGDLPPYERLRVVATAPHDVQIAALQKATRKGPNGPFVDWYTFAEGCTLRRIPQSRAIFDIALMPWDEDLFAEPSDDGRFSTTDTEGFLDRQRAALAALAEKSKGRITLLAGRNDRPAGWQSTGDDMPKRWRKADPRRVFASIIEQGYNVGKVCFDVCEPYDEPVRARRADALVEPAVKPRDPISKVVQKQLAAMKTRAVQEHLTAYAAREANPGAMLELLLLTFTLRNVCAGPIVGSPWGTLARRLVNRAGRVHEHLMDEDLCEIAADVIGRIVRFDAPDDARASGPGAEWLARAIDAPMPRTDTPEILKGITGEMLARIAQEHGIAPQKTVGDLRRALAGKLPDWRAVEFGADGPDDDASRAPDIPEAPDGVLAAMNDDPDVPDAVADAWTQPPDAPFAHDDDDSDSGLDADYETTGAPF